MKRLPGVPDLIDEPTVLGHVRVTCKRKRDVYSHNAVATVMEYRGGKTDLADLELLVANGEPEPVNHQG